MGFLRNFPITRMRRLRAKDFIRNLVQENQLTVKDLIWPVFITEGTKVRQQISSMPDIERLSIDELIIEARHIHKLGIPAIALFPVIEQSLKTPLAEEAWNPQGLIPRAIATIKSELPQLGVITDIALDPYTSHGQDGILDENENILNDITVDTLVKQALCHAAAGVDIVAPSDMMDGRIGLIRQALDAKKFSDILIISYAVKYASSFYSPFREALGSATNLKGASKSSYQMNPANSSEAIHECELDLNEGADILMVKPGMLYLDIIYRVKSSFNVPVFAYQISGEYAMLVAACQNNWLDRKKVVMESLIAFKRAGADSIFTYFAKEVAEQLNKGI